MGFFGSLIGQGLGHILPFKKGGKVRKMQNGGAVLDAQDKMAIKALNTLSEFHTVEIVIPLTNAVT